MTTNEKLGQYIREKRELLNINQKEIADTLNIDRTTLSKYESGKRQITIDLYLQVCEMLNISPCEFFNEPENKPKHKKIFNYMIVILCIVCFSMFLKLVNINNDSDNKRSYEIVSADENYVVKGTWIDAKQDLIVINDVEIIEPDLAYVQAYGIDYGLYKDSKNIEHINNVEDINNYSKKEIKDLNEYIRSDIDFFMKRTYKKDVSDKTDIKLVIHYLDDSKEIHTLEIPLKLRELK